MIRVGDKKFVATAHHVVANSVAVRGRIDEHDFDLSVVGVNPYLDVALLTTTEEDLDLPDIPIFQGRPYMGQFVICKGFADGSSQMQHTHGNVSGRQEFPHNRVRTSAAVNPGNSGGPIVDSSTGHVLGIVTTSRDDLQNTSFFTSISDALLSWKRMIHNCNGVDMGYHLNAVVVPMRRDVERGLPDGAYVAGVPSGCSQLQEGDVIVAVRVDGGMRTLDSRMRVESAAWAHDRIDFRTLLDTIECTSAIAALDVVVHRKHRTVEVTVPVGPPTHAYRNQFADCDTIDYVAVGGAVLQMLTPDLATAMRFETDRMRAPRRILDSLLVVTHVAPTSPFLSTEYDMAGHVVRSIEVGGVEVVDPTLADVRKGMPSSPASVRLRMEDGTILHISESEAKEFEYENEEDGLKHGFHSAWGRGAFSYGEGQN